MRIAFLVLSLILSCFAQRTDTIFYQVASGVTTTAPTYQYTSAALRNNGQTQHLLTVVFQDNGANACAEGNWYQGSDWASNGLEIVGRNSGMSQSVSITNEIIRRSVPSADATQRAVYLVYAYGAYQQLYARLRFNSTNCTATVYYAGTLFPLPPLTKDVLASNVTPQGYQVLAGTLTCDNIDTLVMRTDAELRGTDIIGLHFSKSTAGTLKIERTAQGGSPILAPDYEAAFGAGQVIHLPLSERSYIYSPGLTNMKLTCTGGSTGYLIWWERLR